MADILLIHGAAHGAWCWRDFTPELEALGHQVEAIDLPSHGQDNTPVNDVSLELYAEAILSHLDRPRVILGHSMAGYPISLVAERRPDLVQRLIYLCAYVPQDGLTLSEMRKLAKTQPLVAAFVRAEDGKSFTFDPVLIKARFYADCSEEQIAFAAANLCPQAIQPSETVVDLGANYASVPRNYIRCVQDSAVPYDVQQLMTKDWPEGSVADIATSHSPFFSNPGGLARIVNEFLSDRT